MTITLDQQNTSFKNIQPAYTTINIPCEEIMSASNYDIANGIQWALGARQGSASQYEYIYEDYFTNPNNAISNGGPIGYTDNAFHGNCEGGETSVYINEYLPSAEYVLTMKYDVVGNNTNEEWYNFHTTNPFGNMGVLFVFGAMIYGGIKLINAILPGRSI